jgi:ankyrin repeat protein
MIDAALRDAVVNGRRDDVLRLLTTDESGRHALHVAARQGDVDAVRRLLDGGADMSIADEDGRLALHCAAACGNVGVLEVLLDRGADVHVRRKDDMCSYIPHFLKDQTIDLNQQEDRERVLNWLEKEEYETALYYATKYRHIDAMRLLLDKGAHPSPNDPDYTVEDWMIYVSQRYVHPIHIAAENGDINAMTLLLLLERGINVNCKSGQDFDYQQPLQFAVNNGQVDTVRFLLGRGASVFYK